MVFGKLNYRSDRFSLTPSCGHGLFNEILKCALDCVLACQLAIGTIFLRWRLNSHDTDIAPEI